MLHGYRLFSEEIFNEYAAQTMFFQSQAFPTENKPEKARFCLAFLISKKSQRCSKKARISKSGFKKARLATLLCSAHLRWACYVHLVQSNCFVIIV